MIKFFRKIRQNLLKEGNTGCYFKNAVGEILLVVIGILIALQLNNWNEQRNQLKTKNTIYLIIKQDLISDIKEFEFFIKGYEDIRVTAFNDVLTKNLTLEDWHKTPNYYKSISGYEDMVMNQRGINLLNDLPNDPINIEKSLTSKINKFYNEHKIELEIAETELGKQLVANHNYFQNFSWFPNLVLKNEISEEAIHSFSSNILIKNRIGYYAFLYEIYINELRNFNTNAEILVIEIDNYLNNKP